MTGETEETGVIQEMDMTEGAETGETETTGKIVIGDMTGDLVVVIRMSVILEGTTSGTVQGTTLGPEAGPDPEAEVIQDD